MKVVLFCGGLGMRLRDYSESIPKPMVSIGYRPLLWYIMRYYAHFGHKDFILCLGYRADSIKQYFLKYDETISNDFVMTDGGKHIDLLASDIQDWKVTFVDTGLNSNIGMRLKAVQPLLKGEEMFLANYSDGVSDLPLPTMIDYFKDRDAVACFAGVVPTQSFHLVSAEDGGRVTSIRHVKDVGMRVNGGFFLLRQDVFDWIKPGEELVQEPFQRMAAAGKLLSYYYDGFWACLDTFKDKQLLEDMYSRGHAPWEVWKARPSELGASSAEPGAVAPADPKPTA
jgi:glucose-1-phosphate cytidylyltransferase